MDRLAFGEFQKISKLTNTHDNHLKLVKHIKLVGQ